MVRRRDAAGAALRDDHLGARWARWATRWRRVILAGAIAVGIAAAPVAARLPIHGDLAYLLPPETPSVRDLHKLEARAQVFGTIIVAIASEDTGRRQQAAAAVRAGVEALPAGTLAGISYDNAARDGFAYAHRYLLAPTDQLTEVRDRLADRKARLNPLFVSLDDDGRPAEDAGALGARLRGLKAEMDAAESGAAHPTPIVSRDGHLQIIVLRTPFAAGELSRNAAALRAVTEVVDRARAVGGPAVRIGIAGDVIYTALEHEALLGSVWRATLFTVAIVAAGMLLFFGSPWSVAALLGALGIGSLMTFAFARLTVGHLNLATAFLAPIVVGNGINFGIIFLARYFEERDRTPDPVVALGIAVRGSFGGTLGAALTASVSYASLLATDFRGFRHFGVIAGAGILFCWAATYLVLPAALAALEARGLGRGRSPARLGRGLARLVPRRPLAVVLATGLLLGGAGLGAWRYLGGHPLETDFKKLRSDGPTMRATQSWSAEIDRAFGRGISGTTVIALPTRQRAREVAALLRAADRDKPAAARMFARVAVLDDLVPADQPQRRELLGEIRSLLTKATLDSLTPADRAAALALRPPARIDAITDADVPAALVWPFTERDGTQGRLIIATTGPGFDMWRTEDLDRFARTFQSLNLGPDVVVGGNALVQHDIVRSLSSDGPRATLLAAAGAAVVVLLILGVSRQAVVTLLCAASGVFLLLSAAGVLGLKVNFLDFVALPITIGIGIDYAVNIAARHRAEGRGSAARIVSATGPAVALCSYTTVVGYASLLLSQNQGIRSFGLAALIGELTCVGAALILAPALLELAPRWRTRRATARPSPAIGGSGGMVAEQHG